MKMIVISEESFNRLFDETLKELELEKLKEKDFYKDKMDPERLHRHFHYAVHMLKDKLVKG